MTTFHLLSSIAGSSLLRSAFGTLAVKLHPVMENLEMVASGNAFLKCFEGFILEFDNLAALEADQVIMVALPLNGFILCLSICKFPLGGKPQTGEKLEGSIDCRIANFGIDLGHLGIDLT
jgi:hypothetical protein